MNMRKKINEEGQSVIKKVVSAPDPRTAAVALQRLRDEFGFSDINSWISNGTDVCVEVEKSSTDDSYFYDMLKAMDEFSNRGVAGKRAVAENGRGLKGHLVEELKSLIRDKVLEAFDPNDPINKIELFDDPKVRSGKEWADKGGNFPVKRNGKIFWVSRSVAVSLATFCFDKAHGVWCVLANKRGPGCNTKVGCWNLPCGFLDYGETGEQAAIRETWEETGVAIPKGTHLRLLGTNTMKENVSMAFTCVLSGSIEDYPLSDANSEPGEVADIKWIPVLTAGGTPLDKVVGSYHWDRDPSAVIGRAQTALLPYIKSADNYDMLVNKLKDEIKQNPTAMFLLNKILSMA